MRDREIVETELALADLETVERRLDRVTKKAKSGEKDAIREKGVLDRCLEALTEGRPIRSLKLSAEDAVILKGFQLLTSKPVLYVANVSEDDLPTGDNEWTAQLRAAITEDGPDAHEGIVSICSAIESELAELDDHERQAFLEDLGLSETGLNRLIRAGYDLLGLQTFFTTGENESRAWTIRAGSTAPQAAGTIHTDFERGFIKAETIHVTDFDDVGTWKEAREKGRLRQEGKEYVVTDGDIMLFKFNV